MIIRFCVAAVLMMPSAAMAQGNPGPFGGLFGRTPVRVGEEHTAVEVRSSLGGQYNSVLLAPEGRPLDPLADSRLKSVADSGFGGIGTVGVIVEHASPGFNANLRAGASRGQYFTQPTQYGVNRYNANALVSSKLTDRFEADAAAGYGHSPYFEFYQDFGRSSLLVDDAFTPFSPYAVTMAENDTIDASAGLTTRITNRTKLVLGANHRQTRFAQQPNDDFLLNGYRASLGFQLRRDLGVHAGYSRERVDHRGDETTDYDNEIIDIGVDFNRAFSLSRRTILGFTTSTALLKDSNSNSRFRVNGAVSLSKQFRRTWSTAVQASRETSFVPGFVEPIFSDTVGVSLSGMFSKRLNFLANAGGGRGESAFSRAGGFGTVAATSQLGYAISKRVSAFAQYIAYWYEVPSNAITLDVPDRMARQVVSVGFSLYVPVYQKMRPAK